MTTDGTKNCPACFGISWSATDPKCAGGPDPSWVNEDGTHTRPKCDWYSACGARKMAASQEQRLLQIRMQPQQQQVPYAMPQQYQMQPKPQQAMQMMAPPQPQQMMAPQMMAPQMMNQMPMNPYQMMVQAPMQLPMQQMMPVNFAMPGYLSTPEPYNGSYVGMLGMSILRAMFKAAGHTVANVLDTVPFGVQQQGTQEEKNK